MVQDNVEFKLALILKVSLKKRGVLCQDNGVEIIIHFSKTLTEFTKSIRKLLRKVMVPYES